MGETVIRVENIAKQYRLGITGTGSLAHDLNRWWHTIRGNEDPYLRIGDVNDRTKSGTSDYVWALQDISFDVKRGEVLGIVGRNGAGKSTLLKILSRTTAPSRGKVKIRGRIASLLEVGTGFHPELSGRDNIFLNGSILGMTAREIRRKFDEIVDFAGVERYIDTPVKRYSSGMYVRLAFAVAAHLEPEILVVDEVLAVGDVEFQNKCLGKMREGSTREGRTVLFVSHNMAAVNTLCDKAILLKYGRLTTMGTATDIVSHYMNDLKQEVPLMYHAPESKSGAAIVFDKVFVSNANGTPVGEYALEEQVSINLEISNRSWNRDFSIGISINDTNERRVLIDQKLITCSADDKRIQCRISLPPALLTPNTYTIDLAIEKIGAEVMDFLKNAIKFEILKTNTKYEYLSYDYGLINKACSWEVQPHRV